MIAKRGSFCKILLVITLSFYSSRIEGYTLHLGGRLSKAHTNGFQKRYQKSNSVTQMSMNQVPGSFFNPVPEENDGDEKEKSEQEGVVDNGDEFDKSLSELIKKRTEKPRAASPSTIGGKPIAKGMNRTDPF